MKRWLMSAALAATALTGTNASAATLVDFTMNTDISGTNVPGSPTTASITGQFDYDALLTETLTSVSDFSVLIGGTPYSSFPLGVGATLNYNAGGTGLLNFTSGASTIFSFDLAGLTTDGGRPPVFGTTLTNATSFNYGSTPITINAGLGGTISVVDATAAVPEPGTWAMMLLGFGFIGGAMRSAKRRQKLTVSYA